MLVDVELLVTPGEERDQENVVHLSDRALAGTFDDFVHQTVGVVNVAVVQLAPGLDEFVQVVECLVCLPAMAVSNERLNAFSELVPHEVAIKWASVRPP